MKEYSFSKGLWKGVKTVAMGALLFATFAGLNDLNLWDIATQYLKPLLSTLTVGGVLTIMLNWIKVKSQENQQ